MENSMSEARQNEIQEARDYLSSLINKYLRVTSTDGRIFWGQFRCIDPDRNIILSQTFEYRQPSVQKRIDAVDAQTSGEASGKVKLPMTSRFMGLVVVPGRHIAKVELEEFASQLAKPSAAAAEALRKRAEIEKAKR
ncbi:unnamed protein product [Parascedosporium putredinis]|uniref:Sm domain-containing protein n=1 Tax=Parascedosporium putredinis TaxID=1442378 RepID=A0A9P1H8B8_9PEZI|nr:unnamed protein product [Parascedosporium putredinis]CAI8002038.1 unnamed protein product [Parascedosporium putredinis]